MRSVTDRFSGIAEVRHPVGELRGLVCVATKADRDLARAPVDANPLVGIG
jgi:hypothetical protein